MVARRHWRILVSLFLVIAVAAMAVTYSLKLERDHTAANLALGVKAYDESNYTLAYKLLLPLADDGNARAQTLLGHVLSGELGGPTDYVAAAHWFAKAAAQGDAEAMYELGDHYRRGKGVERDFDKAEQLIRDAAEAGYGQAQHHVAISHFFGTDGLSRDRDEGLRWHRRSALQGYEYAVSSVADIYANTPQKRVREFYTLGYEYNNGVGVPEDEAEAALWYRAAAEEGNDFAERNLTRVYERDPGVRRSMSAVIGWYRHSAQELQSTGD